jgi:hypothetical protein
MGATMTPPKGSSYQVPSTPEDTEERMRLSDLREAAVRCAEKQALDEERWRTLGETLGVIKTQGAQHLAAMVPVTVAAEAVSHLATMRTLVVLAILASLPTVAAGVLLLIILGNGGDLLHAAVSAAK